MSGIVARAGLAIYGPDDAAIDDFYRRLREAAAEVPDLQVQLWEREREEN